ncbi:PQQ-binding-like beta-propeller repeat protein [Streptosporangium amethystogenes]|uniref:outer membrane protein assembly factor BamB family protein n=1 Tax=Streptosporangium amethystogenes TaxID=2002 RepID=UPI0037ACAF44
MSFRHYLPRPILIPTIVAVALLAVPAGTPALPSGPPETSPIIGTHLSGDGRTLTARVSATGRVLWKSTRAGPFFGRADLWLDEPESAARTGEDFEDAERKAATFTGRHVAIETEVESDTPDDPGNRRRITVIDALTGLPAWSILSGRPADDQARPSFYLMGAAAGRFVIDVPALRVIRALDPRDGTIVWERRLPGDCVSAALPSTDPRTYDDDPIQTYSLADRRLAVAMTRCAGRRTTLTGIDPATGRVRWERRLPPSDLPRLSLEQGVSILTSPHAITIFDENGLILTDDLVYYHSPSWRITAGAVIVSDGDWRGPGSGVRSISRSSGRIMWSRPDLSGEVGTAAGKIYLRPEEGNMLNVLDPADGHTLRTLSAPLTEKDIGAALAAPPDWGRRGGVPTADWPDPCALLPAAELASRSGTGGYTVTPIPASPELGLTTPLACEFSTEGAGTAVTVSVVWVYPSVEKAAERMTRLTGREDSPNAARHLGYFYEEKGVVAIREGRVVATVEAFGDHALLRHALRITGERLRK